MFRAYLPSIGKKPTCSVKNASLLLPEPPITGDYVGVLSNEYIQVDIDHEDYSQLLLKIIQERGIKCNICKTTRGLHFYFLNTSIKRQSVGAFSPIGIQMDIGLGSKDRVVPLRINGLTREWLVMDSEIDYLPIWLKPMGNVDPHITSIEFRNQSLFNYILVLQKEGFLKEDVRTILTIINKYMLKEPLPDDELATIMRDDAFSEEIFFDGDKFIHNRFGDYLLNNYNIAKVNSQLSIYTNNGLYSPDKTLFEKRMLSLIPSLKTNQRTEVLNYIKIECDKELNQSTPKFLGLKDEILNVEDLSSIPYSPEIVINNKIDYNYNSNAYHELMDNTLNKIACNDPAIRNLIEEMVGYTLYRKNSLQKMFILTGEGRNGKSTFVNLIKCLLGKGNYSALEPREFDEKFTNTTLNCKLANIGDDISNNFLNNTSTLKKLVTGDTITVQNKGGEPFEMESYATLIFCANEVPRANDTSHGWDRRLIVVPFNAKFDKSDPDYDPFIEDKLSQPDAIEYLLKLAVEGLQRVLVNKEFSNSAKSEEIKKKYVLENNPILEWFELDPKFENETVSDVYMQYKIWCMENNYKPLAVRNFSKQVIEKNDLEVKVVKTNNKSARIYVVNN